MSGEERFTENCEGSIKDNETGLIWSKKDSWHIEQDWLTFDEGMAFIDKINKEAYLGQWDWRIPERPEAEKIYIAELTLLARSKAEIHISPLFEPGGGNGTWCLPFDQQAAFYMNFSSGMAQHFDKDFSQGYVRPVRLYPE